MQSLFTGSRILAFTILLLVAGIQNQATAQETATYQSEYSAYTQAIENGDRDGAERHGLAAWQLAEETLGDHQLTGILAFNYGQLVIFTNAEGARAALRRAEELRKAGLVELPEMDLNLFLAYSEFAFNRQRLRQARNLREALLAVDAAGIVTNDTATMWLHLAASDFQRKRYEEAILAAEKAEDSFIITAPKNHQQIANAIVIAGAAKIVPFPRKIEDTVAAHEDFERAIRLFPPQKDFESFDPVLAQARGWFIAADAAIASLRKDHNEVLQNNDAEPMPELFEIAMEPRSSCNIVWEHQKPPDYPSLAISRGYIGAVIIIYDLKDDLKAHNPRVLAEVPVKTFSRDVLKSIKNWKLQSVSDDRPGCRQNRQALFTFVIPY